MAVRYTKGLTERYTKGLNGASGVYTRRYAKGLTEAASKHTHMNVTTLRARSFLRRRPRARPPSIDHGKRARTSLARTGHVPHQVDQRIARCRNPVARARVGAFDVVKGDDLDVVDHTLVNESHAIRAKLKVSYDRGLNFMCSRALLLPLREGSKN